MATFQCGEEGSGAGTDVSVRDALDVAEPEGPQGRGSLQCRGRALLVHAEPHRVIGRIQVESDDIADLLGQEWIGGELEVLRPVGLEIERAPEAVDCGLREARGIGHGAASPVCATTGGLGLERPLQPRHEVVIFDGARSARLAFVVQAPETLGSEALAPLADRLTAGADPLGDRLVVQAIGAQQHDLGPAHQPGGLTARTDKRLEFLTGTWAHFEHLQRTSPGPGLSRLGGWRVGN